MTLDGFREMTTSLERFNGIISNISVGTYDEEFSQPANKWDKHEIQAVTGAEIGGQRATILSDGLCEMFCRSQKQHTVMIQLSDSPVKEIFLPFCANTAKWRKAICAVSLDDRQVTFSLFDVEYILTRSVGRLIVMLRKRECLHLERSADQ